MYVRKFEGDTLEEAINCIKKELGPDAIILKTITNKGLKGAFKKKKIEITAAISEKNYSDKMRVDHVLNDDQKEKFYQNSSGDISSMIDQYSDNKSVHRKLAKSGYGGIEKNRPVKQIVKENNEPENDLDTFLNNGESFVSKERNESIEEVAIKDEIISDRSASVDAREGQSLLNKISSLEKAVFNLEQNLNKVSEKESFGVAHLRTMLATLDINEKIINEYIKKCLFELSREDLENPDIVFEFILREMLASIQTKMPLFSKIDSVETPSVTIFLSESSCGQSSIIQKIASMKSDAIIIRNNECEDHELNKNFTDKLLSIDVVDAFGISAVVSEIRKAIEKKKTVFVDYKVDKVNIDETKKFFNGIKRGFDHVEFFVSLSAIHSEIYNRKILNTYRNMVNGIVLSHLDLCLNFGALYNISHDFYQLPFVFYSTGKVVPDDIESATAERILGGIFDLDTF